MSLSLNHFFSRRPVREVIQSMKRPIEDDSDSSEEEYPTQIPCKRQATPQRFQWNAEMIEQLLIYLVYLKTVYEFKGIGFEFDLVKAYREVQKLMAEEFVAFCPLEETPIDDGLSTEEISKVKSPKY